MPSNKQTAVNNRRGASTVCYLCYAFLMCTYISQHFHLFIFKITAKTLGFGSDEVPLCSFCFKDILNAYPFESDASP
jgi:hypothetical protein